MKITLDQAIEALNKRKVVAVPTETVYGLAAKLTDANAIAQIFNLKGRPSSNPLIIHVSNSAQIEKYARDFPADFQKLADAFWPGPMTLIVPINEELIFSHVRANLSTAGFRVPNHPLTIKLLKETGPLVMPSANLSGKPSATSVQHVEADFGLDFPVLDGGVCVRGVESTILAFQDFEWVIVRLGSLSPDQFRSVLGYVPRIVEVVKGEQPICPGQLFRHYAPKAKLIFEKSKNVDCVVGFTDRKYDLGKKIFYLGSSSNENEVAENLYKVLRQLDDEHVFEAWVDMDFPRVGLWLTIAERLERAAV